MQTAYGALEKHVAQEGRLPDGLDAIKLPGGGVAYVVVLFCRRFDFDVEAGQIQQMADAVRDQLLDAADVLGREKALVS